MTEITAVFGPMVASQLLYTVLFLVGAAAVISAMEQFKRIRGRYAVVKLSLRYAWPYLAYNLSPVARRLRVVR